MFDIAYFIAKEGLPFTKMAPLCQLKERHGINLGTGYKNNQACTQFVEFIAKVEQQNLVEVLSKAHYSASKLMVAQTVPQLKMRCVFVLVFLF